MGYTKLALFFLLALYLPHTAQSKSNNQKIQFIQNENLHQKHETERYTVLIYGDPMIFNEFRLGAEVRRLEESFELPVLAYKANNLTRLKSILLMLTRTQLSIQNLIVRGIHGYNFDNEPIFEVVDHEANDFDVTSFKELSEEGVSLNFSPSAFVFFDSCDLINSENTEVIKDTFNQMKLLGFETGWIYLNDTEGAYSFDQHFKVPFWKSSGGLKVKLRHFVLQVIGWPVTAPLFYYKDHFEYNIGYLMGFSKSSELLFKTHAMKVSDGEFMDTSTQ